MSTHCHHAARGKKLAFVCMVLTVLCVLPATGCRDDAVDFVTAMNVGTAHLENREADKAIEAFSKAVQADPASAAALRNLARAQLLLRKHEDAITTLGKIGQGDVESASTQYLHGLALQHLSRFEQALPFLERAVQRDPHTATLRFQLAGAMQAVGEDERCVEQLKETIRLDPLHSSAHYKLSTYARRVGDREGFRRHYEHFEKLRKMFGDETRSAEVLEMCVYTQPESATPTPKPARPSAIAVVFKVSRPVAFAGQEPTAIAGATVLEVVSDGKPVVFLIQENGSCGLASMQSPEAFTFTVGKAKLANPVSSVRLFAGDFFDDVPEGENYDPHKHRLQDMLILADGTLHLWKRTGDGGFQDVTREAGLSEVTASTASWIDYEHDGDLDLLLGGPAGLKLWQNIGDGMFTEVSADAGIEMAGAVVDMLPVDLDADVAIDFIVARGDAPSVVFENQRVGRFRKMPEPPGPWPAARCLVAGDFNNDGRNDVALAGDEAIEIVYGGKARRERIDVPGWDIVRLLSIDYDNDGWSDLLVVGNAAAAATRGVVRLFRNDGHWTDVGDATELAKIKWPALRDALVADLDADGDTDIALITTEGEFWHLSNQGGHVNGRLCVRLVPTKTNPSGLGAEIEFRHGDFYTKRLVQGQVIELGLAGHTHADSLRTLWTNGVVDHQIDIDVGLSPITIQEKIVATGSCPLLYAWNGSTFRFVTDLLGNAPIGLPLSRDVMLPADTDEIVFVGDSASLRPKDGRYLLQITDEFREVVYLDEARLLAVDHSPGVEVHPTDKIMPPPFPPSELWSLTSAAALVSAVGDDGVDRTDALRTLDGRFAPPGLPLVSPYRGMCHPMALTLDFGTIDTHAPLVLALTGWLQYGDGSTNIALSQDKSLTIIPPALEVETGTDQWQRVNVTVGMPAGKTKTILCDLTGKLPPGARRLRLTTTFEIRWDRIALLQRVSDGDSTPSRFRLANTAPPTIETPPTNKPEPRASARAMQHRSVTARTATASVTNAQPGAIMHELKLTSANLRWRGFSEMKSRTVDHPTTPAYDALSQTPPWRTALQGWCTRYGDVMELMTARDNALVILNAGDALELAFDAHELPPIPNGMVRSFFLFTVGWDKDGDHNVVDGDAVGPLPVDDSLGVVDQPSAWRTRYNTRWVPTHVPGATGCIPTSTLPGP